MWARARCSGSGTGDRFRFKPTFLLALYDSCAPNDQDYTTASALSLSPRTRTLSPTLLEQHDAHARKNIAVFVTGAQAAAVLLYARLRTLGAHKISPSA